MDVRTSYIEKLEKDKHNGKCRKWRLWIRLSDGKKRSRRFTGAYREAQQALADFRAEIESEVVCADSFAGYADSWLSYRIASCNFEVGTIEANRTAINVLDAEFGKLRLDELTPDRCRDGLTSIRNGGGRTLSGAYMNKLFVTFHAILRQAHMDGRIARDPLAGIPAPKVDTREKDWLSPDELAALVDRLGSMKLDGRTVAVYLIAYLGLRRGEACGIHTSDVDMDTRMVHVRHAVKERSGRTGDTKTSAGMRDLPIPDGLYDVLSRWVDRRAALGFSDAETFACSTRGTMLTPQNFYQWWERNKADLGADGMTLHQIRHSNLSMMARHMNVFDLQRWAGWSSIAPAKTYVHADAESLKAGSEDAFRHHFGTTQRNRPED